MPITAKVLLDSVSPDGHRLTTMELTYPRFVHAEYMTHRMFSRNAASSRAIPVKKMIDRVLRDPVIPIHWGANQKGMQAFQEIGVGEQMSCEEDWLAARDYSVDMVQGMISKGLHKQIANRLLEPWMWITVIHSATEHENFFNLRCHEAAEPHIQALAYAMRDAWDASSPVEREWHMPLTGFEGDEKLSDFDLRCVSVARCARISYLTHDGKRDVMADTNLFRRLYENGHWSPFEHVAYCGNDRCEKGTANFRGWCQYRWWVEKGMVK